MRHTPRQTRCICVNPWPRSVWERRAAVDVLFRIAGIGVIVTVITQVLTRAGREDIAMLASLSGLIVVLVMVVNMIFDFFNSVRGLFPA